MQTPSVVGGAAFDSRVAVSWSSSRPSTRVTPSWRNTAEVDLVGPGQVAGVRVGHRRPLVGLAHLDDDDRHPLPGGVVGGQHERAPVLEALDVGGDDPDVGLVGEPAGEVGELQVDLVARRRPRAQVQAQLLGLVDRPALVSALGDEGDGPAGVVLVEGLEGVQVRVGAEQAGVASGHQLVELGLQGGALVTGLGETGGEDDGEARASWPAPPRRRRPRHRPGSRPCRGRRGRRARCAGTADRRSPPGSG